MELEVISFQKLKLNFFPAYLQITEIPSVDVQADGGTHVKNLSEVGQIKIVRLDNKGSKNKRIYFELF